MAKKAASASIKVKLIGSVIGSTEKQRATVRGLGLDELSRAQASAKLGSIETASSRSEQALSSLLESGLSILSVAISMNA